MKKFLKILSVTLVVLIAALLILPYAFKDKITEIVKREINNSVNAQVDFKQVDLGLLRSFPNFSVRVSDLSVLGNEPFENDTLLYTQTFELSLDIMSVFRGSPYEIKTIRLQKPYIQLIELEDGRQNWAITLSDDDTTPEPDDEALDIGVGLRSVKIQDAKIVFDDRTTTFYVSMEDINSELNGDFSLDQTQMNAMLQIGDINAAFDGMTLARNIKLSTKTTIDANLKNDIYTLNTKDFLVNDLALGLDGQFALKESDIGIDLNFDAPNGTFKQLLSLIPQEFLVDYSNIQADGNFNLSAFVNGDFSEDKSPAFGVKVGVNNGVISYPDLPDKIENILVDVSIDNQTGEFDDTIINLNPLKFEMVGNPFELIMSVNTPVSDPQIDTKMRGKLVLDKLAAFIPEGELDHIKGEMDMDFALKTHLSAIENEQYNRVNASGNIVLSKFSSKIEEMDEPITISKADLSFSPKAVRTHINELIIGSSDFNFEGEITDYLGFILSDGELKGNFNLNSNFINADELIENFASDDTSALSLDFLPDNMDLKFNATANSITFEPYNLKQAKAGLRYKNKKLTFDPLEASMLGGMLSMSGSLDAIEPTAPIIDLQFGMKNFDIPYTYKTMDLFKLAAPIAEHAKGSFSTSFNLKGQLDEELSPVFNTLQGGGGLETSKIEIEGVKAMNQLSSLVGNSDLKKLVTNALNLNFEFVNGRVHNQPFTLGYAGHDVTMSGSIGLDQSLDYDMVFKIPYGKVGNNIKDGIANLIDRNDKLGIKSNTEINIKAMIRGEVGSPKISLDYKDYANDLKNDLAQKVQDKIDKEREQLKAKAQERADKLVAEARDTGDKLIAQAESTAKKIRNESKKTADRLREEADKKADQLVEEGKKKGTIAERLAKEAAKKVRKEAEDKANKLEDEAEKRAAKLETEAQNKANSLVEEAERRAKID